MRDRAIVTMLRICVAFGAIAAEAAVWVGNFWAYMVFGSIAAFALVALKAGRQ